MSTVRIQIATLCSLECSQVLFGFRHTQVFGRSEIFKNMKNCVWANKTLKNMYFLFVMTDGDSGMAELRWYFKDSYLYCHVNKNVFNSMV